LPICDLNDAIKRLSVEPEERNEYQTVNIEGLSILYPEAGSPVAPFVLLLHEFPPSSRMYGPPSMRLADEHP
jgi:hypothetical protein